ncbi:MAG: leucine-rich repeat protein [Clostridia bacterium]|nr:leucine-rich repeat protein [Clostridia bacterium]
MKKFIIAVMIVFVAIMSFALIGCKSSSVQVTGLTFVEQEDGYVLASCDPELRTVVVPSTYKGKPVVRVAFNAFLHSKAESVRFAHGIKHIDRAFCYCENLTQIYVPTSVERMSDDFMSCHPALTVYFEGSVLPSSFLSNTSTAHVVMNYRKNDVATDGYIYITHENAEYGLKNEELWFMNYWGDDLFVKLPDHVRYKNKDYPLYGLKTFAFYETPFLESVYIPDTVVACERSVFSNHRGVVLFCESEQAGLSFHKNWREYQTVVWDCLVSNLADDGNKYTITNGLLCVVKSNGMSVVGANNWYGEVTVPPSVNYYGNPYPIIEIGNNGFENYRIDSINLPNSLLAIGDNAFYGCKSLKSIVVPSSVMRMGMSAFVGCTALESLTLPFVGVTKNSQNDAQFKYVFGYGTDSVPASLRNVKILDGTVLRANAFSEISLEELILPPSLTTLEGVAFYKCNVEKPVVLPRTLTTVKSTSFVNCNNMTLNSYYISQPESWGAGWNGGATVNWGYTD